MNIDTVNYGPFRLTRIRNSFTLLDTETDEAVTLSRKQADALVQYRGDKEECARALHWAVSISPEE